VTPRDSFQDAALLLVAHGSTLNAGSAAPTYQHARTLRRQAVFAQVTEAFLQQDPPLAGALRRIAEPRIFVAPVFISEGWFTETVIPSVLELPRHPNGTLRRSHTRGTQALHYCRPVGSHPGMTRVLQARAAQVTLLGSLKNPPPPAQTTLLIAGHGTSYSPASRTAIERQVSLLRDTGRYGQVEGIFLEEPPTIADAWHIARLPHIVLVPFFISDGLHTQEDIPEMLGEPRDSIRRRLAAGMPTWINPTCRHGKHLWCAPAIGTDPLLSEVILERVREASTPAPSMP